VRLGARLARLAYRLVWGLALPAAVARIWWRGAREPGYRRHIGERLGRYGARQAGRVVWLHAVSVGEAHAAAPLIEALQRALPGHVFRLTCTTPAGRDTLLERYGAVARVSYLPYDTPSLVRRFLDHARPEIGIIMETEIWPALVSACGELGIPLVLANARMSRGSARAYARAAALTGPAFAALDAVCAQSRADVRRLRFLGATGAVITGNLKFDVLPDGAQLLAGRALRARLGRRLVLLAASTREGEETMLLDALPVSGQVLVVVVPRHRQRFDEVARLIEAGGRSIARRSHGDDPAAPGVDVYLGDTLGEMAFYYGLANVALIGGSFKPLGGQNLIEACAAGVPVVTGPHMFNFADATRQAVKAGAAIQVASPADAAARAQALLEDPAARARIGAAGEAFAARHRGATARHVETCLALLRRPG
jgi:3-deoxy-D-manno-octulosonic-acid transferase